MAVMAQRVALAADVSDFIDFSLLSGTAVVLPGRLYVPPEPTANPTTPRPFILYLHGGGETGSNNLSQIDGNIDNLLAEAKRRGAFLYAPQSTGDWSSSTLTNRVMTMIDRAMNQQHVDANRLYVTGLSNGGGGTWNMLSRYDDRFAAAVPISGVSPASDFVAAHLIDASIWAFHARDDNVVSVDATRNVINSILAAARERPPVYPSTSDPSSFLFSSPTLDLRYIELPAGGHGIGPAVYSSRTMYEWLFAHTLAVPEPNALVLAASGGLLLALFSRRWRH